ncbi:hypothetical protein BGZ63DRAFT_389538 [Mariannaea sp. PMI_226]|nr:hypothetical protein BGZ63DRAFT_389538 [Mariannaea sp. PMI_226]
MVRLDALFATLLLWSVPVAASTSSSSDTTDPVQSPSTQPVAGQLTSHGCYKSNSATASGTKLTFASSGTCAQECRKTNKNVIILQGSECFCADTYPPRSSQVKDELCNYPCPGYSREACGGLGDADGSSKAFSVFNSGRDVDVDYDKASSEDSSSSAPTSTSPPSKSGSTASDSTSTASASTDAASTAAATTANTSHATSTPSSSAKPTGNDASHVSSGVHALVGLALALII